MDKIEKYVRNKKINNCFYGEREAQIDEEGRDLNGE